jgi:aminoglycoside phosphotransferase family enzyme/predicted kinase
MRAGETGNAEVHRELESRAAFPQEAGAGAGDATSGSDPVEIIETHLSRLYFVGARVFKVKKAVHLGFVDFSTLEQRKFACDEEVRLNRRLAPDIYLGVRPIVHGPGGGVHVGGTGVPIEYAVEMVRLPAAQMFDAKLARGEIDRACVDRIVARLADFHERAERGPEIDRHAAPEALARRVIENLAGSRAAATRLDAACKPAAPSLSPRLARFLEGAFARFIADERARFVRRIAEKRICEGHGDLHTGNLCILPSEVVAFDCIEFSRALRCLDVAADLAFLLMDLDRLGFRAFGRDLARRYSQRTHDPTLQALVPFYEAHLACVRGKVAALRGAGSADASVRARSRSEAIGFFAQSASYALPPLLLATTGLPGSGKSFVARALAPRLVAVHLQSDFERKRLAGVAPTERAAPQARAQVYSEEMTRRTYAQLFDEARRDLERGRRVLLDATFPTAELRARAADLARELGVPFVLLACSADDAQTHRRLAARALERNEFSDADAAVYDQAKRRYEPPAEIAPERRIDLAGDANGDDVLVALLDRVLAQLDGAGRLPATFPLG